MTSPRIQRAILSVTDKTGLVPFAAALAKAGVQLYSTGGTRKHLESAGLTVEDISEYTGFPEMMDGRLKTLHPKIFGGILCRHDHPQDMQGLQEHGISAFELVVVNLYAFENTVARPGVTPEEAIENIDIGGPSLVRAAAKNHAFTTIATSPAQYDEIAQQIAQNGCTTIELRRRLAAEAYARTGAYDAAISSWFARQLDPTGFPATLNLTYARQSLLRYGENPHQQAAVYRDASGATGSVVTAKQINGKELSYNNLLDLDSALAIVRGLARPAASVIKHNNPCGAAWANELSEAAARALAGDPLSAFGGVLGFNRPVDAATAEVLAAPGLFIEAIAAPSFTAQAAEILTTRPKWKANVRLIEVGSLDGPQPDRALRPIHGGLLAQDADTALDPVADWKIVTRVQPSDELVLELRFAWEVCRHVKSNAIVITAGGSLVGAGAGQMSRVDSVEIAIRKAGDRAAGAALASDAFFPFPDSIHKAAAAGIAAIIQPGGSVKDAEVIAACDELKIAMIFTGRRHFKH